MIRNEPEYAGDIYFFCFEAAFGGVLVIEANYVPENAKISFLKVKGIQKKKFMQNAKAL